MSRILQAIEENPQTSQRRLSNQHGISLLMICRILKEAKFYPYRLRVVHSMHDEDHENRVDFANEMLLHLDRNPDFLKQIIFSDDEAIQVPYMRWSQQMEYSLLLAVRPELHH